MPLYRKKPVIIEAIQYDGNNYDEIKNFAKDYPIDFVYTKDFKKLIIPTLEGEMQAIVSDYIIKGVNGEIYPCKEDIFNKTYDKIS